jgi:prepilin-type N-terminal cleavage/methylation domain-containing protein
MTLRALPHALRRRRARQGGFTLVELMVAMTGGLFLSIAVFALSRDASRFYQRESRIANATLSGMAGFERLAGDVARAGHMSTPNIALDPRVCNRPTTAWPDGVEFLRAVSIDTSGSSLAGSPNNEVTAAGFTPHGIVISGAFDTTEELYSNAIEPTASGYTITLNLNTPSALRLGLVKAGLLSEAALKAAFMTGDSGRIVRIRKDGKEQYGVVSTVATNAGAATVQLAANPPLQFRTKGAVQCGIDGVGKDFGISVINIVRYDIRSMKAVETYKPLFDAAQSAPFESGRTELVRVELDANGNPIASTLELVAEYAVDLQFGPWAATAVDNPAVTAMAPDNYTATTGWPQLLRGMHLRLSVRSREADRDSDVGGGGPNHHRIPLGPSKTAPFARVRTFQSDVPFRNLENARWPLP